MSETKLWAVSGRGNVYTLSTRSNQWWQVPNQRSCPRGFKKVEATPSCVWGLGCDHQVYLYAFGSDVPIRCLESTYENERWIITRGWSGKHLLPLDPYHWSNEDGMLHQPKEDFKLPSDNWQWEGDWYVDENVEGYITDKGGWRYAGFDFHQKFTHEKKLQSFVRRRRWIKHRRYTSTDTWARIPSIHLDPLEEPVVDIVVGGHEMPNQSKGYIGLWVVTINGRVFYRHGISRLCPEGSAWLEIHTEEGREILNLSVGSNGLSWAVTWNGTTLVRTGVSWQNVIGEGWEEVDPPKEAKRISNIAVGNRSVWVVTDIGLVWYRKGIEWTPSPVNSDDNQPSGSGWLAMVQKLKSVTVGPQEQVWGIGYYDHQLYFRTGVHAEEPTGKQWQLIDLPYNTSAGRYRSQLSLQSTSSTYSNDRTFNREDRAGSFTSGTTFLDRTFGGRGGSFSSEDRFGSGSFASTYSFKERRYSREDGTESLTDSCSSALTVKAINKDNRPGINRDTRPTSMREPRYFSLKLDSEEETEKKSSLAKELGKIKEEQKVVSPVSGTERIIVSDSKHTRSQSLDYGALQKDKAIEKYETIEEDRSTNGIPGLAHKKGDAIVATNTEIGEDQRRKKNKDGIAKKGKGLTLDTSRVKSKSSEQIKPAVTPGKERESVFSRIRNLSFSRIKNMSFKNKRSTSSYSSSSQIDSEESIPTSPKSAPLEERSNDRWSVSSYSDISMSKLCIEDGLVKELIEETDSSSAGRQSAISSLSVVSDQTIDFVWDYPMEEDKKNDSDEENGMSVSFMTDGNVSFKTSLSSDNIKNKMFQPESSYESESGEDTSVSISTTDQMTVVGQDALSDVHFEEDEDEDSLSVYAEPDTGDIQWTWISSVACYILDETSVRHWFSKDHDGGSRSSFHSQNSQGPWRKQIIGKLRERNHLQYEPFTQFELAIEKGYWSKKGKMQWWYDHTRWPKWVECRVDLTQDSDSRSKEGTFSIQYEINGSQKLEQVSLLDIVNISALSETAASQRPVFGIFTKSRLSKSPRLPPLKLSVVSEDEIEDWLAALNVACCEHAGLHGTPSSTSFWSTTEDGDIFVHEVFVEETPVIKKPSHMFWHQTGGHLEKVFTNCNGVTWGLGYDKKAWCYTGGYGGGFFKGVASSPDGIKPQTDARLVHIFENQRWRPVIGYTDKVILSDRFMWSDESGKYERTKEGTKPPSKKWHWVKDWQINRKMIGGTDKEGWQYAKQFNGPFYARQKFRSYVRRRKWSRKCKMTTTGPWEEVGPLPLKDISLQLDPVDSETIWMAMWAIGANGDVLCRLGVTRENPQGVAWHHVSTDLPFTSVSIGCNYRVWATAKDGSAWFRNGVSNKNLIGTCWFHITPPDGGALLQQISAGQKTVWGVDQNKCLWYRQNITSTYPEGTKWATVCRNVRQVSATLQDQIWAIVDNIPSKTGPLNGVVCRRVGFTNHNPRMGSFEYGIGGNWHHICARGWCPVDHSE